MPPRIQALRTASGAYVLALFGWTLVRQRLASRFAQIEVIDIFGAWFYVPGVTLLVGIAPKHRTTALVGLLTAVGLFLREHRQILRSPLRPIRPRGAATLRMMTSNLAWTNADARAFADAVAREQPDVVAVQELTQAMAGSLAEMMRVHYPHQALAASASHTGIGLFSRLPLHPREPADIGPGANSCMCQSVTLRLHGALVQVLNAHPPAPAVRFRSLAGIQLPVSFDNRVGEAARRKLLQRIDKRTTPLVLLGDLNTADRQPYYRELRRRLCDAHREAGWGFGWTFPSRPVGPALIPLVRIDYVLHSPELRSVAEWTGYLAGSDHRYVVADLVWRDQG